MGVGAVCEGGGGGGEVRGERGREGEREGLVGSLDGIEKKGRKK